MTTLSYKSEPQYTIRTTKESPTQRPSPSTYFYPQPTHSSTPQQHKRLTRVEKASSTTNTYNKNNNKYHNTPIYSGTVSEQDTTYRSKAPKIGVNIIQKAPIHIETEEETLFSSYPTEENDDNVITFWVDDPNDIPDILDASSFFDDSPSALLEKFSKPRNPNLGVYPENDNLQLNSFSSQGVNAQSLPRDFEEKGTTLNYPPNYDTSHSHNSYTFQNDSPSLTKSTEAPSSYYSTSVNKINPHEFHGGFVDLPFRPEGRSKTDDYSLDYPSDSYENDQNDFHGPTQRGGRFDNEIISFSDGQDRSKRKSQLYLSDVYQQGNSVGHEEDVEDVVEDDFLEEGEFESTGEADIAFEEAGGSIPSLFSPDAPYDGDDGNVEDTQPLRNSHQDTEEETQQYVEEEEEKNIEQPVSEPPKKVTRYKSTSSINKYKSTSSINKYKSRFEIKESNKPSKPRGNSNGYTREPYRNPPPAGKVEESKIPTTYIKYSETVPKSENSQESNEKDDEPTSYPSSSSNSLFQSGGFSSEKFVAPQNFEIPQEFRDFLSKPPSWINMANW